MPLFKFHISMSLDGYIAGPNDAPGNPGGDGFMRLHDWFVSSTGEFWRPTGRRRPRTSATASAAEPVDQRPSSDESR